MAHAGLSARDQAARGRTELWLSRLWLSGGRSRAAVFLRACSHGLGAAALGCASAAAPPELPPSAPVAAAPAVLAPRSFQGTFQIFEARGQSLTLPLPDAKGWRRDPGETRSWVARHPQSGSRLVVRAWQHDGVARVEDCERQARLWRPDLPEPEATDVVEERQAILAGSYASQVKVGLSAHAGADADELRGYALAFGSDARSCLMLAFTTAASGPGATRVVAERLSAISRGVFGKVRRLGISDRVTTPRHEP